MKRNTGGNLLPNDAFKHILSIGYEIEATNLIKFFISDDGIFINPDTTNKLINQYKTDLEMDEFESFADIDETMVEKLDETMLGDFELRKNELMEIELPAGRNVKFYITNDISKTKFTKNLKKICDENDDRETNDLYKIRFIADGNEYPVNIIGIDDPIPCEAFSNVEWVCTHYFPQNSRNVIADTFTKTARVLIAHLDAMERQQQPVRFIYKNENLPQGTYEDEQPGEMFLENGGVPEFDMYNAMGRTHYFQSEFRGMNKVCTTIQCTLTADVEHIFSVMKSVSTNIRSYESIKEKCTARVDILNRIQVCVDKLFDEFNALGMPYQFTNTPNTKRAKNYVLLILYKLNQYYNVYLEKKKDARVYFKNSLPYNIRHSNYVLYMKLKELVGLTFISRLSNDDDRDSTISRIIQLLIINPTVLQEHLTTNVRKHAFNPKNRLEKTHARYGDPQYSLVSYFDFFENPVEEGNHDWLEYKKIDEYSAKFDIHDNTIMMELRFFSDLITDYIYRKLDTDERTEMEKLNRGHIGGICVGTIRRFLAKVAEKTREKTLAARTRKTTTNVRTNAKTRSARSNNSP